MNAIYNIAAYKMMTGDFNWLTADLMLVAWPGVPTFNPLHDTVSDIAATHTQRGASLPIAGKTVAADGTGQTNSVVVPGITVGANVTWFTLCDRNVVHGLSQLILYIDDAEELPFVPNGLDLVVTPDWSLQRGWFRP